MTVLPKLFFHKMRVLNTSNFVVLCKKKKNLTFNAFSYFSIFTSKKCDGRIVSFFSQMIIKPVRCLTQFVNPLSPRSVVYNSGGSEMTLLRLPFFIFSLKEA